MNSFVMLNSFALVYQTSPSENLWFLMRVLQIHRNLITAAALCLNPTVPLKPKR